MQPSDPNNPQTNNDSTTDNPPIEPIHPNGQAQQTYVPRPHFAEQPNIEGNENEHIEAPVPVGIDADSTTTNTPSNTSDDASSGYNGMLVVDHGESNSSDVVPEDETLNDQQEQRPMGADAGLPTQKDPATFNTIETYEPNGSMSSTEDIVLDPHRQMYGAIGNTASQATQPNTTPQQPNLPPLTQQQGMPYAGMQTGSIVGGGFNTMMPPNPPVNTYQPAPLKKKRNKLALLVVIIPLLLLLGGGTYVFAFYLPNTPENIYKAGIARTGNQFAAVVEKLQDPAVLDAYEKTALKVEGSYTSKDGQVSINIDSQYDEKNSDTKGVATWRQTGVNASSFDIEALVKSQLPDGAYIPNVYFNISGIKSLGLDYFFPNVSKYDGKWIAIEQDFINELGLEQKNETEGGDTKVTYDDVISILNDANVVTQEYVFSNKEDKAVFIMKEFVGTEESEGVKANHYKVGIHAEHLTQYCEALIDKLAANKSVIKLSVMSEEELLQQATSAKKDCAVQDNDISSDDTFDVWFDTKYKLFHKIRLYADNASYKDTIAESRKQNLYEECLANNNANKKTCAYILNEEPVDGEVDLSSEYYDIGQLYKGGDDIVLFVTYKNQTKTSNAEARAEFTVNTETLAFGGTVQFTEKSDVDDTSFQLKVTTEQYTGDIASSKPAGSIPIKQFFTDVLGTSNPFKDIQDNAKDTERKSEINSIQAALEAHYAEYEFYPTIVQINNAEFREQKLKGVPNESYTDPSGTTNMLGSRPANGVYAYTFGPNGCNNTTTPCTSFTLSATLHDGTLYTKKSFY